MDTTTSHPSDLRQALDALQDADRLRTLKTMSNPVRPEVTLNGRRVVDFCSNDYLGLSQHPALIQAAQEALAIYGTGTGGARLIGGTLDLHAALEEDLARFKGTEAALVFNSGYQANVGILSALVSRHDVMFADRLNHASLVDGAVLSRAKVVRYPHGDMVALERSLQGTPRKSRKWIVTDTVFSMDGDQAPLRELYGLACRYDAWLILDEAHATGIFGDNHRSGLWETTGIGHSERVIQVGTFSKALGSFGAYVAASKDVIDTLIQFSRSFVYSTSLPPAVVAVNRAALELVASDGAFTAALWENIHRFKALSEVAGFALAVNGPIVPVQIGDASKTVRCAEQLLDNGFYIQAIRPPTVPEGTSRLRITLSACHTPAHLEKLIHALKEVLA